METKNAIDAFAALAQDTRMAVFRLLIQAGPNGLTAGDVAQQVGVPGSTLSHHLATLERAGLLRSWRVQRQIFYACDYEGTRQLIAFLMEDCCQGRPELCSSDLLQAGACGPAGCASET
ncbi:ArsR/SmtB family transcription factor [Azospirillum doebereinerae]|uniref:ArsR family transcriptional regulator n=1 Tax=Azospirillum doebereinerae TaxID=92933 RepID=A0A433J0N9_9PROT|nr:metalloregulator ArsR/SmtB family transcription factor [Azospirillum doebereinerae]RUQ63060.1 ArsR family transcriptional regulator [Azospirillum doebereinerae]